MKVRTKTTQDPDPTPAQIAAANLFAKQFALRKGLIAGENTNTGNTVPKFVDEKGNELPPGASQQPNVKLETYVPPEINSLEWDSKMNLPYFIHPQTGDVKYVPQDYFYLPRFNPNRGKSPSDLIAKNK